MKHWKITLVTLTLLFTTAFTTIAQPPIPALSAATNIDCSSFIANWNASAGATFYYLEVSTSTSFGTFVGIYSPVSCGNNLTWFVSGLSKSTTYYYRVSASNSYGNSGYTAGTYQTVTTTAVCSSNDTWTQVGSAANGAGITEGDPAAAADFEVAALCSDCKDNKIFVGGYYTSINDLSIPASCIATWTPSTTYPYTGGTWTSIGTIGGGLAISSSGVPQNPHEVYALVYYGGIVYVGGNFTTINGSTTDGSGNTYNNLAQYNVSTGVWSAVGGSGGITGGSGTGYAVFYSQGPISGNIGGFYVQSLAVDNSGHLYVGGNFTKVVGATKDGSGKNFNNIAMWNGSTWSALNGGMTGTNSNGSGTAVPTVYSLDVVDSSHVYAGGQFTTAGGTTASNIAMWNGAAWSSLTDGSGGNGIPQGAMGPSLCGGVVSGTVNWSDCPAVLALANVGNMVYAAGVFSKAGSKSANNIAQWNQSTNTWTNIGGVGGPTNDIGEATAEYVNNGILYVGGDFQNANNCSLTVNNIVGYDGSSWILLPASAPGFQPGLSNVLSITSLASFPSPGYSILYAGGDFEGGTNAAGDPPVNHIAQYAGLPAPTPILTVSTSSTICPSGSATLTAGGATSYTWSPGTGLSATTGSTVTANPGSTTTYTVTGTNVGGCLCACTQTATVVVTVSPTPTVTASAVSPTICSGNSTAINAGGATTYTWSPATGLSTTTGSSVTATPTVTTTYTVTGSNGGCSSTATVIVTVSSSPIITLTPSSTICPGGSATLVAGGATSYTWGPSAGLSATTGSTVTATPGSTTTYTVTGTNGSGCTGTKTVTITVGPALTLSVTPTSPTICIGNSTTLTASGATNYTWSPSGGLSCSTCASTIANPGSTITYTVTGSNAGCTGKDSVTVTVNPTPTVSVAITGISPAICSGDTMGLFASGALTYTWSPTAGLSGTTGTYVIASPGSTTTYTVTGMNASGCTSTASIVITIYPTPKVSVAPSAPGICPGGSVTLNATGASSYIWTPSTNLSCTNCPNPIASPTATTTFTVVGKNATGCSSKDSVTITVSPSLTVTATASSTSVCSGDSVTLIANGASNYTWSPLGGLGCSSCSNTSANPGSTTTYTVTGSSAGCSAKDSIVITVNPSPVTSVSATSGAVCPGGATTLSASGGTNYTWGPATGLSATTGASVTANPLVATTYTVTVANASGCTSPDSITIAITPTPTVTLSSALSSGICSGTKDTIKASGAGSYSWSPSTGLSSTSGNIVVATPPDTITYIVIGTNGSGCVDTARITLAVTPTPTISLLPSAPGICPGDSVMLTASGASNYLWSPPGGLSCTSCSNPTAQPGSTITYFVTGSNGGCSSTDSVTINVGALHVTATPANPTICSGTSTTITAAGAVNYSWSPSTGLNASTGITVTANPGSATTYTLIGTSGAGCSDTTTVTVNVNPTPTISVTPAASLMCKGGDVKLAASGATTYLWSPSGGLNCATCDSVTASPGSTITYTVTGTSSGCTTKDSTVIKLDIPKVKPSASSPTVCAGSSVNLSATGAVTYMWSPLGGLSCTSCSNTTANLGSTTTFTLIGTDTAGCNDTTNITITVNPTPTITVSATDTAICQGSNTSLTATGATNYMWSPLGGLSCTSCSNTTANLGSTTTFTIIGTNSFGCRDTTNFTVTVNPVPTVNINVSGGDTICHGQSATLNAVTSAGSYSWSTGSSNSSITVTPVSSPSTYTVVARNGMCKDSAVESVYLFAPLTVIMNNDSICLGKSVSVGVSISGGKSSYTYSWNNGLSNGPGPFVVTPSASTYYVCTVSDGCGEMVKDSGEVVTISSPKVSFLATPDTIPGGQFVVFNNTSTNATSYYWTFGNGDNSTAVNPYDQYGTAGSYVVTLIGTNSTGCADTAYDTVYVTQGIYIPNVFTPNGDGNNDVFHVTAGGVKEYSIEIFNRWGERVFISSSAEIDWDGRSPAGVEESDGTYYYIIKATGYNNKLYNYDGFLQLIR